MTDPMGKHWDQPDPKTFKMYSDRVEMSKQAFDQLPEYSTSLPSGTYAGKCWKRQVMQPNPRVVGGLMPLDPPLWYLCFFFDLINEPKSIGVNHIKISIVG